MADFIDLTLDDDCSDCVILSDDSVCDADLVYDSRYIY